MIIRICRMRIGKDHLEYRDGLFICIRSTPKDGEKCRDDLRRTHGGRRKMPTRNVQLLGSWRIHLLQRPLQGCGRSGHGRDQMRLRTPGLCCVDRPKSFVEQTFAGNAVREARHSRLRLPSYLLAKSARTRTVLNPSRMDKYKLLKS